MEKILTEILKEIKDVKNDINDVKNDIKNLKSGQDELFAIQRTILERSQFWGSIKERVDIMAAKNDTFQYEIYRDYVRKEKLIYFLEEMKKAL